MENNLQGKVRQFKKLLDTSNSILGFTGAGISTESGISDYRGHLFFGELHEQGKLLGLITQNIDGLHEKGGLPKEKIIILHDTPLDDIADLVIHMKIGEFLKKLESIG